VLHKKSSNVPRSKEESGFDLPVEDNFATCLDSSMLNKGYYRPW